VFLTREFLPRVETDRLLTSPVDGHSAEVGVDDPHDCPHLEVQVNLLDDVFVLVRGRKDLDGQDGRTIVKCKALIRPGHELGRAVGDVDSNESFGLADQPEPRLPAMDLTAGLRLTIEPAPEDVNNFRFDPAVLPVASRYRFFSQFTPDQFSV